jgi:hypothetical protein
MSESENSVCSNISINYENGSDYDINTDDEEVMDAEIQAEESEYAQKLEILSNSHPVQYNDGWSSVPPRSTDPFANFDQSITQPQFPSTELDCFLRFMPVYLIDKYVHIPKYTHMKFRIVKYTDQEINKIKDNYEDHSADERLPLQPTSVREMKAVNFVNISNTIF